MSPCTHTSHPGPQHDRVPSLHRACPPLPSRGHIHSGGARSTPSQPRPPVSAPSRAGMPDWFSVVRRVLPGSYTFILPASKQMPKVMINSSKQKQKQRQTVGVRMPAHPVTLALLSTLQRCRLPPPAPSHLPLASTAFRCHLTPLYPCACPHPLGCFIIHSWGQGQGAGGRPAPFPRRRPCHAGYAGNAITVSRQGDRPVTAPLACMHPNPGPGPLTRTRQQRRRSKPAVALSQLIRSTCTRTSQPSNVKSTFALAVPGAAHPPTQPHKGHAGSGSGASGRHASVNVIAHAAVSCRSCRLSLWLCISSPSASSALLLLHLTPVPARLSPACKPTVSGPPTVVQCHPRRNVVGGIDHIPNAGTVTRTRAKSVQPTPALAVVQPLQTLCALDQADRGPTCLCTTPFRPYTPSTSPSTCHA